MNLSFDVTTREGDKVIVSLTSFKNVAGPQKKLNLRRYTRYMTDLRCR